MAEPLDLDALEIGPFGFTKRQAEEIVAELRVTRAERTEAIARQHEITEAYIRARRADIDRAERAESLVREYEEKLTRAHDDRERAEAAIARVEALLCLDPIEWALAGADMATAIRAALRGDQ